MRVAVAANFASAAEEICAAFHAETGNECVLSLGSTGKLYAQIEQGAPFDVFLAADQARPARCIADGHCIEGSAFTYAIGRLALWSPAPSFSGDESALREDAQFDTLAIANPATAPYGAAAMETLQALGLSDKLGDRIVQGDSVTQTYQFVSSRAADLGFVALSQVRDDGARAWVVPQELYTPLFQDGAVTVLGAEKASAAAFVQFLRSDRACAMIERFGYDVRGECSAPSHLSR